MSHQDATSATPDDLAKATKPCPGDGVASASSLLIVPPQNRGGSAFDGLGRVFPFLGRDGPGLLPGAELGCLPTREALEEEEGVSLPAPYYQDSAVTIYHADCRDILPLIPAGCVDLVLTDPPYPDFNTDHGKDWPVVELEGLLLPPVRQLIFYPAMCQFPLDYTAIHIWHKPNGQTNEHYERIIERNGQKVCRVFRVPIINYKTLPEWLPHPAQKPEALIRQLLTFFSAPGETILDPFLGSGTTAWCAKRLGRRCIGIEIEERYCEIAARRCSQAVMALETEKAPEQPSMVLGAI